jgi:hypothetical protein
VDDHPGRRGESAGKLAAKRAMEKTHHEGHPSIELRAGSGHEGKRKLNRKGLILGLLQIIILEIMFM